MNIALRLNGETANVPGGSSFLL